jgi:hypothetical protein
MSPIGGNQVVGNLFTGFGSNKIELDLTKANIDYVRQGFPTKEAHAYILFAF